MMCKNWKKCKHYDSLSNTCTRSGGDYYGEGRPAGCYRDLESSPAKSRSWIFLGVMAFVLALLAIYSVSATDVTECQTLSAENGVYDLTGNIGIGYNATCLTFSGKNNMTLDCHGYNISYGVNGSAGTVYGIYISTANYTTIQNCNIYDGNETALTTVTNRRGMMIESNFNTIQNNSIWTYSNTSTGLIIGYSKTCLNNTLYNNYVNVSGWGSNSFSMQANSSYNTINQNTFVSSSGYGIYLTTSANNNIFINNTATSATSHGIYLFAVSNNTLIVNTGTSLSGASHGIYILSSNNNTLTANTGTSLGTGNGIQLSSLSSNNNIFSNNKAYSVSNVAFQVYNAPNGNIFNYNTGNATSGYGFYTTTNSTFNTFIGNNGTSQSAIGFGIGTNASNNIFTSNIGTSSTSYGIYMANSYNNVMTSNTGTSTSNIGFYTFFADNNVFTSNMGTSTSKLGSVFNYSHSNTITNQQSNNYLFFSGGNYFTGLTNALFYNANMTPIISQKTGAYTLNTTRNVNYNIFDGADDYVEIPHNESQLGSNLSGGFTISAWINPRSAGESSARIIDKSTGSLGLNGFELQAYATGVRYGFQLNNGTTSLAAVSSMIYGSWTHILITISSGQLVNFYLNGLLSGTANQDNVQAISTITTTNAMRIGNRAAATDRTFDGAIRSVKMWNRTLNSTEIAEDYAETTPTAGLIHYFKLGADYADYGAVGASATNFESLSQEIGGSYLIDNFALTEGAPITNSPIWFSSSTTTEKHIASNLTGSVPINVIVNIGDNLCSEVSKITYTTHSGIKTEYIGANAQSVCNNLITTGYVFNVEQASASNVLSFEYGASSMASTFIRLTIGFVALAILGAALLGIKFIKDNPEVDLKQWLTYCITLLIVTMLGIVLMQYLAGFV